MLLIIIIISNLGKDVHLSNEEVRKLKESIGELYMYDLPDGNYIKTTKLSKLTQMFTLIMVCQVRDLQVSLFFLMITQTHTSSMKACLSLL